MTERSPEAQHKGVPIPPTLGRLLCAITLHDYRVVEVSSSFGSGTVETRQCRRCNIRHLRQGR